MIIGLCLGNVTLPMNPLPPHVTLWLCPVETFILSIRLDAIYGRILYLLSLVGTLTQMHDGPLEKAPGLLHIYKP